jgi:hypothetical protein
MKTIEKIGEYFFDKVIPKMIKSALILGALAIPACFINIKYNNELHLAHDYLFHKECPKISVERDTTYCCNGPNGTGPVYDIREDVTAEFESRTPGVRLSKFNFYTDDEITYSEDLNSERARFFIDTENPRYPPGTIGDIFKSKHVPEYRAEVIDEKGNKNKRYLSSGYYYPCNFGLREVR